MKIPFVNSMFNLALGNVSRIADNVRYICQKYNIQPVNVSQQEIDSQILMVFKNGLREEGLRIGNQVRELVYLRDGLVESFLNQSEIGDIVELLTTDVH